MSGPDLNSMNLKYDHNDPVSAYRGLTLARPQSSLFPSHRAFDLHPLYMESLLDPSLILSQIQHRFPRVAFLDFVNHGRLLLLIFFFFFYSPGTGNELW